MVYILISSLFSVNPHAHASDLAGFALDTSGYQFFFKAAFSPH